MTDMKEENIGMLTRSHDIVRSSEEKSELELLREENQRLAEINLKAFDYIRSKVNSLLGVVGTKSLAPEELDDQSLVEFDPIGIVTQTFQHVQDNLRATNRQLKFAHKEIQAIFETVGSAVLVLDPEGRVVSYNQKVRDLMLVGDESALGKLCREHLCKRDSSEKRCAFRSVMKNRRDQNFSDWNLKGKSFDVIGRPMFDEQGDITHVVLAYHDVSARLDAQNALLQALDEMYEANAKIHGILSSAADGILVTDSSNEIVLINKRAEDLIGFCLTDSQKPLSLNDVPHAGLLKLLSQAAQSKKESFTADLNFENLGQKEFICQARVTVIRSPENKFKGCIILLHDVTEQRSIEQMKDEFVSTAAHELRTPLATIIGYTDLMLMENDFTEDQKSEFLEQIQKKAERLGEIVGDLLDISRIESGEGLKLELKPTRLDWLCEEAVKSIQMQTSLHRFVVDLLPGSDVLVNVDRYATMQILENLLSNAVKYSPEGGDIGVSVQLKGGLCKLTVSDHGLGMTSDQIMRIYDKFYRVDATNTAISGTGLGMTIVKHLVDAQSGQVNITSSPRVGTTVEVVLPNKPVVTKH